MSFKRFESGDITISAESVVAPIWSSNTYEQTSFFTSSGQVGGSTGDFYFDVYSQDPASVSTAAVQFAVAYGNLYGSGSVDFTAGVSGSSPSAVVYGQYRTLIYGDENQNFKFGNDTEVTSIYAISIDRARYKEKILPASLNLKLTVGGTSLYLTDNSKVQTTSVFTDAGRVFQIVSGSNGSPASGTGYHPSGSYGLLLPDIGVIVLNGDVLDLALSLGTVKTSNTPADNQGKLFSAIKTGASFKLRSEETVTSNYVFVRVRNSEFNYTTNSSNISSTGELVHDVMINNPQSYITTVGLYNDTNDLVAVAKLSRPLLKDFTKEALIRIKLDY
jgi:hypothetical protein